MSSKKTENEYTHFFLKPIRLKSQIENLKFKMKNKPKSTPQFNTKIVGGNIVILWGGLFPKIPNTSQSFTFPFKKIIIIKKYYYYFFKIIFLWFLFPSLLLQNSRSVSLFGLTSSPHSLSLKVFSLFLAVSIFSEKIRDTHWRFSVHVWLLRSLSID